MAIWGTGSRYGPIAQILHWLTAILVVTAFIYGPGGSEQRVYSIAKDLDRQIHETLGISVLTMTLIRLVWRAFDTTPDDSALPAWMRFFSNIVQWMLYVLLLAVPLTAICGAWLEGHALTLLGGIRIAPMLTESHEVGSLVASVHTWLGDAILWLAGIHAAAALFHHFVLHDRVLRSMLPWQAERSPRNGP